jgi:hypothetical protein
MPGMLTNESASDGKSGKKMPVKIVKNKAWKITKIFDKNPK